MSKDIEGKQMFQIYSARAVALWGTWIGKIHGAWSGNRGRDQMIWDAIAITACAAVVCLVEFHYDLAPMVLQFGIDHRDWEIDNLLFTIMIMSFSLLIFGYRRVKDLSRAMRARKLTEMDALRLARHDPLTGLPNRRFFVEKLNENLSETTDASRTAVLMLDLDGFKLVNDAYGHAVGDLALQEFARRVTEVMHSGSLLTRIGGDEFAIIAPNISSLDDPTVLARRIIAALGEPFLVGKAQTTLGVGIGIAIAPEDGMEFELLVQHADRALYRAKAEGRNSIRFFEAVMNERVERRIAIENELRAAISAKSIVPFYQPLVAFAGERIIGFEALARWKSDKFGWVPPDQFITIAEELGLISELGDQLLRQACVEARTWPAEMTLAFNVSGCQLRDPALGLRILAILAETGLNPRRLELEITETALVDNMTVAQNVINHLREAGVRIALDDFGTGYATLSQLLSFRLDRIKIDRSFVERLGKDVESDTIVRAILGLAKGFGLATTAEGIEDADQLQSLRTNGCLEGQGYLFGKAVPANQVEALLRKPPPHMKVLSHA
jgi:diguanylate cyclase (GGDEF)-like protein